MKKIKNILAVTVLLVGLFAFNKANTNPIILKNIKKEKIVKTLSAQEFGCRPSSELNFYVETTLIKKYRGYAEIEAKVFVLDKTTNQKSMLTSENVIVANHKDSLINYDKIINNSETTELENGHIIIHNEENTSFNLVNLLDSELIYNRYITSTNKLLNI
tara:strand:- start:3254 stop:3733 length:480 start_codon:yes stop_codon:yes gene_type:complete